MNALDTTPAAPSNVALLFTERSVEQPLARALMDAGLQVSYHANLAGLVAGLGNGASDIAIVQDIGGLLTGCMAGLRVRGISTKVVAMGDGSLSQITRAFKEGASDYVVMGDDMTGLVNRVRARLGATASTAARHASLEAGDCVLDATIRALRGPAGEFRLTEREFELARLMFEHVGETVNSRTLAQQVWGRDLSLAKRTIEQHVCRLRHKLRSACDTERGQQGLTVKAVNGVGYRLLLSGAMSA